SGGGDTRCVGGFVMGGRSRALPRCSRPPQPPSPQRPQREFPGPPACAVPSFCGVSRAVILSRPPKPPSSSGLGHHPLKVATRVRIPLGVPHAPAQVMTASVSDPFERGTSDTR